MAERSAGRAAVLAAAGVLVGIAAIVLVMQAGSSDEDSTQTSSTTTSAASIAPTDGSAPGGASSECESVHSGHQMKMWNPTMADEMVDSDCGWPYPPFELEDEPGEDVPGLDAAFEARHYSELWQVISAARFGTCSVATNVNGGAPGALFEFTYELGPPGCPDAVPDGALVVAEYGTEAQRDAAATAEGDGMSLVLGRWHILLTGRAEQLEPALVAIGGQRAD